MSAHRDVPFQELLNQTAEHCGLDSERLGMSEGRGLATFLSTASREMLRENDWPGAIVTERRYCEYPLFTALESEYETGAIVRETIAGVSSYWRCIYRIEEVTGAMGEVDAGTVQTAYPTFDDTLKAYSFPALTGVQVGDILVAPGGSFGTVVSVGIDADNDGIPLVTMLRTDNFSATAGQSILRAYRPSECPLYWEAYTAPLRISYEQTGKTPILDVLAVYSEDPATTDSPAQHSYTLDETGILLDPCADGDAWVRFRKPPPRFTVALWSAARAYVAGDIAVVWPHCYLALQAGTNQAVTLPAYWQPQTLPEKVSESVCLHSAEKWLRSLGRHAEANALRSEREDALDRASRVRNRQEGQTRTYSVATRQNATAHNFRPRRAALS